MTEPLKDPDTPALRPAHTNTQHQLLNNSQTSTASIQTDALTWVEDLSVQHGHVLSTSCLSRKWGGAAYGQASFTDELLTWSLRCWDRGRKWVKECHCVWLTSLCNESSHLVCWLALGCCMTTAETMFLNHRPPLLPPPVEKPNPPPSEHSVHPPLNDEIRNMSNL